MSVTTIEAEIGVAVEVEEHNGYRVLNIFDTVKRQVAKVSIKHNQLMVMSNERLPITTIAHLTEKYLK